MQISNSTFDGNAKENLEITEADAGSIWTRLIGIQVNGSAGDEGILIEEAGTGSVDAALTRVLADGNKKEGLEVTQDQNGTDGGTLALRSVVLTNNNPPGGAQLTTAGVVVSTVP